MINTRKIDDMQDDLNSAKQRFLRQQGWEEICNLPGSVWYWTKDIKGKTYALGLDDAYAIESNIIGFSNKWECICGWIADYKKACPNCHKKIDHHDNYFEG